MWGVADFSGGLASRRIPALAAVVASQAVGLVLAVAAMAVSGEVMPGPASLAWATVAGLAGLGGIVAFYQVLASGEMSLAAPLVAVISAGVPAGVGVVAGERLDPSQGIGLICGLAAVVVVSRAAAAPTAEARSRETVRSLPLVVCAGSGFAGFFLAIHQATQTGDGSIWWPLMTARVATVGVAAAVLIGLAVWRHRRGAQSPATPRAWATAAGVGALLTLAGVADFSGNGLFLVAQSEGAFSLAVILSSLYPVVTAILAARVLGERLTRGQLSGVALALVGVVLIAI